MYMIKVHNLSGSNLPLRESLEVAGTPWVVATNSELVLRSLRRWRVPHQASKRFAMRVLVDDRLQRTSADPVYRGMDHIVFASFGPELFGFDLLRNEITAVVSSHTASNEKFWNRVLVPIAIGVMGCFIGAVPLHSACLEWNGVGVFIAGISGSGKSTLSAAMADSGFSFLSDDWTYVSMRNGNMVAFGLGIPFKLLPEAARFFGGFPNHQVTRSMNGELAFDVDPEYFGARSAAESVPRHLFLLERRASGASEFQKLAPDFVRDFFERSSEPFPHVLKHGRRFRSIILDQVARLHCWRFIHSGSPHDAAACIRRFIEQ